MPTPTEEPGLSPSAPSARAPQTDSTESGAAASCTCIWQGLPSRWLLLSDVLMNWGVNYAPRASPSFVARTPQ